MAMICFIEADGTAHHVDAVPGWSLMEAAVKNGVPGIDADCGGACACATCHVLVDPAWLDRLSPPDPIEAGMIEFAASPASNSRLACQITLHDSLDGLTVTIPHQQK